MCCSLNLDFGSPLVHFSCSFSTKLTPFQVYSSSRQYYSAIDSDTVVKQSALAHGPHPSEAAGASWCFAELIDSALAWQLNSFE